MALKTKFENNETIPAELSNFYIEKDGIFLLDIEGGIPDVQGLKSALESERELHGKTSKSLKKLQGVLGDLDEEKIKELISSEEKYKTAISKTSDEMASREEQLIEKWDKVVKDKDTVINGLNTDVEEYVVKSAINSVIAELKGDPEVLYDPIRKSVKINRKENGGFGFQILDAEGKVRVGDNSGADMTIVQRAEEFKQKKGFASAFPTSSGGGAPGNERKQNNVNNVEFGKLSPTEKLKQYRSNT